MVKRLKKLEDKLPFGVFTFLVIYYLCGLILFLQGNNALLQGRSLIGVPLLIWIIYDLWLRPPKE